MGTGSAEIATSPNLSKFVVCAVPRGFTSKLHVYVLINHMVTLIFISLQWGVRVTVSVLW